MKKIFKLFLASLLMLGSVGCSNTTPQDDKQDTTNNLVETEVLVIGGGGAGLAAAASAGEQGAKVIVLEANGLVGGSTLYSGGHMAMLHEEMNAAVERNDADLEAYLNYEEADFGEWAEALTRLKQQVTDYLASNSTGRFDSVERMLVDHYLTGRGTDIDGIEVTQDYQLVKASLEANWDIFTWLQSGGMEIENSFYKVHANSPVNGGSGLVNALKELAANAGAEIILNTRGTELILEDGRAVGVKAVDKEGSEIIYSATKGVILATGSFSSNGTMASEYQRIGTGLTAENGSTNPPTNKGDGILMAQSAGAQLLDMQFMSTVMQGYHGASNLSQAGNITGNKQLVVNAEGVRYGDETKGTFTNLTNDQTSGLGFYIGDKTMVNAMNAKTEGFTTDMTERGFMFIADTIEEAAELAGLDAAVVKATVDTYNSYVENENDPEFGRSTFNGKVENAPYVISKMEMHYHLTFGGLVIDEFAHVLDTNSNPINGLFAAGDILSGFEGKVHQSGDCLSVVVYSGKLAGESAANNK